MVKILKSNNKKEEINEKIKINVKRTLEIIEQR